MVDPSLPPGTTHADIDRHHGPPEMKVASGSVTVGVEVEYPDYFDEDEIERELQDALGEALDEDDDRIVQIVAAEIGEVRSK